MTGIRVIETGLKPACWNIAMTAALTELHSAGAIPNTVRLYRYRPSVLIGRNQTVREVVRIKTCERNGIEIARRMTGGGAVYMDAGVLAWDIIADRRALGGHAGAANALICEGVARGLKRLGLAAEFRPPADIEIGGRKISGSSGYCDGSTYVCQGTVLIDADLDQMVGCLRVDSGGKAANVGKARAMLASRVINVVDILGHRPADDEIETVVALGIADVFRATPVPSRLEQNESGLADAMFRQIYGTDDFVMRSDVAAAGNPPPRARRKRQARVEERMSQ